MERQRALLVFAIGLLAAGLVFAASEPDFRSAGSTQYTVLDEDCPARDFPPIQLAFASTINSRLPNTTTNIRCATRVTDDGEPERGVRVTLGGTLATTEGDLIQTLPTRTGTTTASGYRSFTFPYQPPPPGEDIVVIMEGLFDGLEEVDAAETKCDIVQRTPCRRNRERSCLLGNRFQVEVDWRGFGDSGKGQVLRQGANDALFYFVNPSFPDLLVQLLQRCSTNDHYWVFYAATTSVEFEVSVTDTFTGEERVYDNPLGTAAPPIQDTSAFATCP